jgi:hypothetical protein
VPDSVRVPDSLCGSPDPDAWRFLRHAGRWYGGPMSDKGPPSNDEAVFWITNHHAEVPPAWIAGSTEGRRGYFENEYGEQWFAQATRELFRFTGGDMGWQTVTIAHPDYRRLLAELGESSGIQPGAIQGVILSPAEKHWMRAMLVAGATAP